MIVELDGGQHAQRADYDAERTTYLQARGYRVLRIWNDELLQTPDAILEGVWRALKTPSPVER